VRSNAKLLIDCEAYNVGWNPASFAWSLDSAFAWWDPYYPYRHPGRTANVAYMDGHVGTFKSFLRGEGSRAYVNMYLKYPDGTNFP
jgi:prepilin-type processing-associated H-X9-DG protein